MQEGQAAEDAVSEAGRRTTSRRELARRENFEEMSPDVGVLDEDAVERALSDDPDETLALLSELTGATDPKLRELARRLAGRIVVDLARRGSTRRRGVGKLKTQRLDDSGGDLDVDASIEGLLEARAAKRAPAMEDLKARGWTRPDTALALVVDRSGSMGGDRLAVAAVAASAVAWRAPDDYSVLAFSGNVIVPKSQDAPKAPEAVVNALLTLRGHGTTDLALALRAARVQLERSRAARKITVLLSDCRSTVPGDPEAEARATEELVILAPEDDAEDAEAFARATGAKIFTLSGPSAVPEIFAQLLPG